VPTRPLLRAALVAICLAGIVASALTYASQVQLTQAIETFGVTKDFARALRDIRASDSALNPNVFRDAGIARSLLHTGHPLAAERTIARVTRDQPGNVVAWVSLTRIQLARGRMAAARASWARVRRLNPHAPVELPPPA
jgi:cytochrome c-type biogenesis protein CcmH/NrfG